MKEPSRLETPGFLVASRERNKVGVEENGMVVAVGSREVDGFRFRERSPEIEVGEHTVKPLPERDSPVFGTNPGEFCTAGFHVQQIAGLEIFPKLLSSHSGSIPRRGSF